MHDKKPSPGGRWRGEAVTDEGKGFDIRVLPSKQVKAFAPQVRRWRGAAMTDEGDHGGASVIDGMTGHDGSCRGGPPCPPVDNGCTHVVPLIRHGCAAPPSHLWGEGFDLF